MNVRLVVPRRADGGHRDRLWDFCRFYWQRELPQWPIVEGHHEDGPFNRSAAVNAGAEGAWDVAVILDGDVILDADQVTTAVKRADASGYLVLPHNARHLVSPRGTRMILDGYIGSWDGFVTKKETKIDLSSCLVVRRDLWDQVGGFDPRFVGWGGEDNAFYAACSVLGGIDRTSGTVWHLHHRTSPWRDHRSAEYCQAKLLSDRYEAATEPAAMRRLLAEPRSEDQVVVVALSNGNRDTLAKALHSAEQMVRGPIGRKVIAADGPVPEFPGWDIVKIGTNSGYCKAVAKAIDVAIGSGQPWVFWLEDDFVFNEPVDLVAMQAAMEAEPRLVQMSLKRQAWYEDERAAGGIIEANPSAFRQRDGWVEHSAYWTMNPMLCRRSFLASRPWARPPGCENRFGRLLFDSECEPIGGIWGAIDDAPRVTHIGAERAGRGY